MERFKAGDKVKFLNEKGGGVVVREIDSRMVLVSIEDGFEIPVLSTDLVIDAASVKQPDRKITEVLQKEVQMQEMQQAEEQDAARRGSLRRFAKNMEPEGVYLAFVPHEQQWILTGVLDVVLVNHTDAEMLYSFAIQNESQFENVDYGQIAPHSKLVLETIGRDDLNYWTTGLVQAVLVLEKAAYFLQPVHAPFDVKPNRFYKEGSYVMSAILGEKAIMISLQPLAALKGKENLQLQKEGFVGAAPVKNIVKEKPAIDKHRSGMGEAVVDLHIAELVDNIAGLSSQDLFKIQLDYFHKMLNSAIENDYNKVTFIHGVGNGVLKNAIIKALEAYEGTETRMASMSKFGVGAIDVLFTDKEK